MGKGEIARYEQFLLFPHCFQKLSVVDAPKRVSMELRVYLASTHYRAFALLRKMVCFSVRLGLTHYQMTISDSSNLKEFADDNFKFYENGRKLSKRVENTGGKGEIARYEQFLLFPQCFQKACFPGACKGVIVWEWVK